MLLLSLSSFAYSLILLSDVWEVEEMPANVEEKFKQRVSTQQIEAEIERQIQADDLEGAKNTVQLATHFDYNIDVAGYRERIDKLNTFEHRTTKNVSDFFSGFLSGKADSGAGVTGAVVSDFTVVGDVRDLSEQYQIYQKGQDVNQLIVTLSGVGIGLTVATIGSGGGAAPVKAGTSLLKLATKMGRLSRRFSQELVQKAQKAFDWRVFTRLSQSDSSIRGIKLAASRAFDPRAMQSLSELADQANSIRKNTSTLDTLYLIKYAESTKDLKRIEKIAAQQGKYTKGIMKFLGKSALRGTKVLKKSIELILSALSLLLSGILSLYFMFPARKYSA